MTHPNHDIVDNTDFCRSCRGTGEEEEYRYEAGRGNVRTTGPCWYCRGSGRNTIRVSAKQ